MPQAAALRLTDAQAARYRNASPEVTGAIHQASLRTGVDFAYLMEKASAESGFRTGVKAPTSSATGLFQFIDSTWMQMVKSYGAKYGFEQEADAVHRRADGRFDVADPELRQKVLELRKDPRASALLAGEYARENRDHLRQTVGGDIGSTELYMAHFLGPQGAARFLTALRQNPNQSAAEVFPEAARANKGVFYRDGEPATLQQVYDRFDARFETALQTAGIRAPEAKQTVTETMNRASTVAGRTVGAPIADATSMFTVMMLNQLGSALDDDRGRNAPALGGKSEDGARNVKAGGNADPIARVMIPMLGT